MCKSLLEFHASNTPPGRHIARYISCVLEVCALFYPAIPQVCAPPSPRVHSPVTRAPGCASQIRKSVLSKQQQCRHSASVRVALARVALAHRFLFAMSSLRHHTPRAPLLPPCGYRCSHPAQVDAVELDHGAQMRQVRVAAPAAQTAMSVSAELAIKSIQTQRNARL